MKPKVKSQCDRCKKETNTFMMSFFNTEMCCLDCIEKEQKHPEYEKARKAELGALHFGMRNYEGIGLPKDLRPK